MRARPGVSSSTAASTSSVSFANWRCAPAAPDPSLCRFARTSRDLTRAGQQVDRRARRARFRERGGARADDPRSARRGPGARRRSGRQEWHRSRRPHPARVAPAGGRAGDRRETQRIGARAHRTRARTPAGESAFCSGLAVGASSADRRRCAGRVERASSWSLYGHANAGLAALRAKSATCERDRAVSIAPISRPREVATPIRRPPRATSDGAARQKNAAPHRRTTPTWPAPARPA